MSPLCSQSSRLKTKVCSGLKALQSGSHYFSDLISYCYPPILSAPATLGSLPFPEHPRPAPSSRPSQTRTPAASSHACAAHSPHPQPHSCPLSCHCLSEVSSGHCVYLLFPYFTAHHGTHLFTYLLSLMAGILIRR